MTEKHPDPNPGEETAPLPQQSPDPEPTHALPEAPTEAAGSASEAAEPGGAGFGAAGPGSAGMGAAGMGAAGQGAAQHGAAGAVPPTSGNPPPPGAPAHPWPVPPTRSGSAWGRVWGSTVGKVAVVGGGVFALLLAAVVVAGIGFAAGRHTRLDTPRALACAMHKDGFRGMPCVDRGGSGSGSGGRGQGRVPGQGNGPGAGAEGQGDGSAPRRRGDGSAPQRRGDSLDRQGLGGLGMAGALHGEVTLRGLEGTPTTMLFQVGEVTEYTAGSKLTVKSSDGYTATYAITSETAASQGLAKGSTVRVLATKDGSRATRVRVLEATAATST